MTSPPVKAPVVSFDKVGKVYVDDGLRVTALDERQLRRSRPGASP